MAKTKYEVLTWDTDKQTWTPQRGVRRGPYTLFGLRVALRKLRSMGYGSHHDFSLLVQKVEDRREGT